MNKTFVNGREPYQGYWKHDITLYRGDEIIDTGTIQEIAERRGVQKLTIYYYLMPIASKRADSRKSKDTGLRAVRNGSSKSFKRLSRRQHHDSH